MLCCAVLGERKTQNLMKERKKNLNFIITGGQNNNNDKKLAHKQNKKKVLRAK